MKLNVEPSVCFDTKWNAPIFYICHECRVSTALKFSRTYSRPKINRKTLLACNRSRECNFLYNKQQIALCLKTENQNERKKEKNKQNVNHKFNDYPLLVNSFCVASTTTSHAFCQNDEEKDSRKLYGNWNQQVTFISRRPWNWKIHLIIAKLSNEVINHKCLSRTVISSHRISS